MTTRDEVLAALKAHAAGLTSKELAPLSPAAECDVQVVGRVIAGMRSEGLIHPGTELREGGIIWLFGPAEAEQRELASLPYAPAPRDAARAIAAMRTSKAAERAPDRAPMPVTTPAPARPAVQEEAMKVTKTVVERAVEALKQHGPMKIDELAKRAQTTRDSLYTYGPKLRAAGVTKTQANAHEPAVYAFGKLPASAQPKDALAAGADMGRKPAAPATRARVRKINGNGHTPGARIPPVKHLAPRPDLEMATGMTGAQFAINELGELGIEKGGSKLRLDREEFYRLREFVQRTESVWQVADKVDLSGIVNR